MPPVPSGTLVERQNGGAAQRLHLRSDQVVGPIATTLLPGFEGGQNGGLGLKAQTPGYSPDHMKSSEEDLLDMRKIFARITWLQGD